MLCAAAEEDAGASQRRCAPVRTASIQELPRQREYRPGSRSGGQAGDGVRQSKCRGVQPVLGHAPVRRLLPRFDDGRPMAPGQPRSRVRRATRANQGFSGPVRSRVRGQSVGVRLPRGYDLHVPGIEGEPHAVPASPMARPRGVEKEKHHAGK